MLDIKKITGEYSIHEVVHELDHHFPRTIQISSSASTSFTHRVAKFISTPFFRRLSGISQLGLIVQIYPTATHSRLEHILGTFSNVCQYCDALWNDPINPLFKQIMSEKDINLVLLASLCHDIGQYPLAHDLEEAEKKLFSHKEIGIKILNELSSLEINGDNSLKEIMHNDWGVETQEVIALLSTSPLEFEKPLKLRFLHSLIDGPIDADKVDYLIRDSNNLNVPYAKSIDIERLLKCLTVVFKEYPPDSTFISLGIHEKGKIPAEAIAFSRYAMFGNVYWHHTSRCVKSMLHHAIWEPLKPMADRKSKAYRDFHRDFVYYILQQISSKATESLFPGYLIKDGLPEAPQFAMTDYQMLIWLYTRSSQRGKNLLKLICERRVFKRLLVISERKNQSLWEKLVDLRENYGWKQMLTFQEKLQQRLVESIDTLEDDQRVSSILSKDKTDDIVTKHHNGEVLFLVDIPTERKGGVVDLYFKSETRLFGPLQSTEDSIHMEDSVLWTALSKNFLKSIGKIRVFCDPKIIETCTAALKRSAIETILDEAYQIATSE